ncbi:MAG TPA: hypothetical protein VIL20_18695 [Sandaracinaceae bacterium]
MSFFKKLFGGTSFEDERREADRLFEVQAYEDARLAYQRALDRKQDAPPDAVEHCKERVAACLDRMAEARIAQAEQHAKDGQLDLARGELETAMELAASAEVVRRARLALDALEQEDAKRKAEVPDEISDEDRWALLAGGWEGDQADEYDEYGDAFREALLALHDGKAKEARAALEALLAQHEEEAVYLWLEVGRARLLDEDFAAGEEALRTFLGKLDEDEGGNARMSAHAELAALRDREGDEDGAIAELRAMMDAFPDDPRSYYLMGRYLREKGYAEEAAEVLEAAVPLLDEDRPDVRFLEELGLAKMEAGESEQAAAYFDRVIQFFVSIRRPDGRGIDFPPATAVARAKLHEEAGELQKAADLYRALANGSDRANHMVYHREAGRLLIELELFDEARRMLTRALALAEGDAGARADIEAQLARLE